MLGLKLNHVIKRGPGISRCFQLYSCVNALIVDLNWVSHKYWLTQWYASSIYHLGLVYTLHLTYMYMKQLKLEMSYIITFIRGLMLNPWYLGQRILKDHKGNCFLHTLCFDSRGLLHLMAGYMCKRSPRLQFEMTTVSMIKYHLDKHKCMASHYIMPNQSYWLVSQVSKATHDFWALIQYKYVVLPV